MQEMIIVVVKVLIEQLEDISKLELYMEIIVLK